VHDKYASGEMRWRRRKRMMSLLCLMQRKRFTVVISASSMLCTMSALVHPSLSHRFPPMPHDIVIIKDSSGYRLLHGHLRLTNILRHSQEVIVEVKGEGRVSIRKTGNEYLVGKDCGQAPLHQI
jgi:hypothetical protein